MGGAGSLPCASDSRKGSGVTPVKLDAFHGLFMVFGRYPTDRNGGFLAFLDLSSVLTSQGSQVQSLPRPPLKTPVGQRPAGVFIALHHRARPVRLNQLLTTDHAASSSPIERISGISHEARAVSRIGPFGHARGGMPEELSDLLHGHIRQIHASECRQQATPFKNANMLLRIYCIKDEASLAGAP